MPLLLRAKCVVVGDSGVGKSAIAQSFHSDGTHFPKAYTMVSRTRSRRGSGLQGCMHAQRTGQQCVANMHGNQFVQGMDWSMSTPSAPTQTKGVEICVKTVALPDSKDSVVGGVGWAWDMLMTCG